MPARSEKESLMGGGGGAGVSDGAGRGGAPGLPPEEGRLVIGRGKGGRAEGKLERRVQ